MPAVSVSPTPKLQFFDLNGAPLVGGKLYSYVPGSTTPLATYTSSTGVTANTNPVVLDSRGEANVWLSSAPYKLALYSATDVLIWTVDNLNGPDQATLAALAASGGSALIGYQPAGIAAVTTTVQAKLRQVVSVLDFGAVADGNAGSGAGTDNTAAFQNAIDFIVSNANLSGALFIPAGIYKISSQISVPANVYIYGDGGFQSVLFAPTAFNSDGLVKFNGIGGAPSEIHNVAILGQVGGTGASSIGLNLAANGSFGFGIWAQGFQTAIQLASSSVFLYDSVIDQNQSNATGLNITSGSTIASNIQIYNNYVGVGVSAPFGDGPVTLSNIQVVQCPYIGISINTASNVQLDNCSVGSQVGGSFAFGGIYIANSSNINISNFIGRLTPTQTSGNAGITSVGSSKISISNSVISNFYRGISIQNGSEISIDNNICSNNYDIGIYASGADRVIISSNNCNNNGGGTSNVGIYSDNTAANALHNLVGNICTNLSGGGPQNTGLYINLANNGASSGFTNIVGNMVRYNNTNQISLNGLLANINQSGNY
tara:strand:+ start:799 stop:2427 length:1629 start_codon:yes stop_codon:yes gene_type:complete